MKKNSKVPITTELELVEQVRAELLDRKDRRRFQALLRAHLYLGGIRPVGEQLCYVVTDAQVELVGLMVWNSAAKHLKRRDRWIGWTPQQRERRLALVVNQSRFLVLPDRSVPNLGSKVLGLTLERLSADWQARYGHPVLVTESFVDPEHFDGTVYHAQQWLGDSRLGWAIENGLHLRMDVSQNDNRCRIRQPKSMWVVGMLRRLANSLCLQWLMGQPKPKHKTTTDFQTYIEEDNLRRGLRFVTVTRPSLKTAP